MDTPPRSRGCEYYALSGDDADIKACPGDVPAWPAGESSSTDDEVLDWDAGDQEVMAWQPDLSFQVGATVMRATVSPIAVQFSSARDAQLVEACCLEGSSYVAVARARRAGFSRRRGDAGGVNTGSNAVGREKESDATVEKEPLLTATARPPGRVRFEDESSRGSGPTGGSMEQFNDAISDVEAALELAALDTGDWATTARSMLQELRDTRARVGA